MTRLFTVGHGTASSEELSTLLRGAGIEGVVDVRSVPGSRRHPQFGRDQLEEWMPGAGLAYRWERDLGGFRRTHADSPNLALRHPSFRGYADYMASPSFADALRRLMRQADSAHVTVMCSESLWWRCHRRLIADAATLRFQAEVIHIGHDGRHSPHRLTEGVRLDPVEGQLIYDVPPADGEAR